MTDGPRFLTELVELLQLHPRGDDVFEGRSQDLGWGQIFGGQVLGQALAAAEETVVAERLTHSLHAYFLRRGDPREPVEYRVDRIRDGGSFSTRGVTAAQKGRPIASMMASFQGQEPGFDHAAPPPADVPPPEGLPNQQQLAAAWASHLPEGLLRRATAERPIEIRPIEHEDPLRPVPAAATRHAWFRAAGPLPDDPRVHRHLLAYASDFHFLTAALLPHGVSWLTPGVQVASIDHAMWFHRPFRADEWLLYAVDGPSTSGARGLVRGRFFTRDGLLVASTAQEGLLRDTRPA